MEVKTKGIKKLFQLRMQKVNTLTYKNHVSIRESATRADAAAHINADERCGRKID